MENNFAKRLTAAILTAIIMIGMLPSLSIIGFELFKINANAAFSDSIDSASGLRYTADENYNTATITGYTEGFTPDIDEYYVIPSTVGEKYTVTAIGDDAFKQFDLTPAMEKIVIPGTVVSIGKNAFYEVNSLQVVRFRGEKEAWDNVIKGTGNEPLLNAIILFGAESGYELIYDANGGTGAPAKQVGNGHIPVPSAKPTRDGYTFVCWEEYLNENGTAVKQVYPGTNYQLEKDTVLHAKWEEIQDPIPPVPPVPPTPVRDPVIRTKPVKTVEYLNNVDVKIIAVNMPKDSKLVMYEGDEEVARGNYRVLTYHIEQITDTRSFTIKAIDKNGDTVKDRSGKEVIGYCTVNVNKCFITVIINFIKSLIGKTETVKVSVYD